MGSIDIMSRFCVIIIVIEVLKVGVSYGLGNSNRHPYAFVKPMSDNDGTQGPSPYSYSNSGSKGSSFSPFNSNKRPSLSFSDLDDKKRSLSSNAESSYYSSNDLFENVPLPPINDDDKKDSVPEKQNEHMGDFNARLSTTKHAPESKSIFRAQSTMNSKTDLENEDEKNRLSKPIIGDTTKDNRRRVVIPLRYRNKKRRTSNDEVQNKKEIKEEKINKPTTDDFYAFDSLSVQETRILDSSEPSIKISFSDFDESSTTTTTTLRPTVVTSSTRMDNKPPAFVLNLKQPLNMMEDTNPVIDTYLSNMEGNKTIRDPLALPLNAEDLKNWGSNHLLEEGEELNNVQRSLVEDGDNSDRARFSDSNILFADGDIYSRLQKHKQVFTSRKGEQSKLSSYHKVQSRELPRSSPTSPFQDMEASGSSPKNITKHPKAQPYRRYKSGMKDDYYYYDYDYDNFGDDYIEDDYYYRDYDEGASNLGNRNALRRNSKPTQKPKFKLIRKKPLNYGPSKSRYPASPTTDHRYETSSSVNTHRRPTTSNRRNPYPSHTEANRFQNHRIAATNRPTKLSSSLNQYHSKSLTSSDKYAAYGYNTNPRIPSSQLVKKSNKRQGVPSKSYNSNQGRFSRPSKNAYSASPSSSLPYNNPRRANSGVNINRPFTSPGAGVGGGSSNQRGPLISSSTRRDKYYDYKDDDYYYDDEEAYDDYYDYYDTPSKSRQKSRRRQSSKGAIDRQYGGGGGGSNPLTLLVAPLAAISLLAAAAAVALNPVLVSVSLTGKKRRRRSLFGLEHNFDTNQSDDKSTGKKVSFNEQDVTSSITPEVQEKIDEMQVLEKFLGSVPSDVKYQQQILAMYLSCSGYTEESNQCLDRVVCEYSDSNSGIEEEDRDVISIVLYNIMGNDFVGEEYKGRLRKSAKMGRDRKNDKKSNNNKMSCATEFPCLQLDSRKNDLIPETIIPTRAPKQVKQRRKNRVKLVKNN